MAYNDIKEMLKDARNLASGAHDHQTVSLLKDIQLEVYDLLDENRDLREKIHELENIEITDNELEYRNGVYTKGGIVYCSVCWDRDKKLVRARQVPNPDDRGNKVFQCDACKEWRFSNIPSE